MVVILSTLLQRTEKQADPHRVLVLSQEYNRVVVTEFSFNLKGNLRNDAHRKLGTCFFSSPGRMPDCVVKKSVSHFLFTLSRQKEHFQVTLISQVTKNRLISLIDPQATAATTHQKYKQGVQVGKGIHGLWDLPYHNLNSGDRYMQRKKENPHPSDAILKFSEYDRCLEGTSPYLRPKQALVKCKQ